MKENKIDIPKLLPCPFCGAEAEVKEVIKDKGINRTGTIPDGAELDFTSDDLYGRFLNGYLYNPPRKTYHWVRKGYTIRCTRKGCFCRTTSLKFNSMQEAADKWNERM